MKLAHLLAEAHPPGSLAEMLTLAAKELGIKLPVTKADLSDEMIQYAANIYNKAQHSEGGFTGVHSDIQQIGSLVKEVHGAASMAHYLRRLQKMLGDSFMHSDNIDELVNSLALVNSRMSEMRSMSKVLAPLMQFIKQLHIASNDETGLKQATARACLKQLGIKV